MFKLFRALGLRHLVVVDNRNEVSAWWARLSSAVGSMLLCLSEGLTVPS